MRSEGNSEDTLLMFSQERMPRTIAGMHVWCMGLMSSAVQFLTGQADAASDAVSAVTSLVFRTG